MAEQQKTTPERITALGANSGDSQTDVPRDSRGGDIQDTDIVFDCPHCGHGLVIDYRGAGLITNCTECGKAVQVPIPDGMELADLDQEPEDLQAQVINLRRSLFKAEQHGRELEEVVSSLKERRSVLEKARAGQLHRLAEIRGACEHIQRLQAEVATTLTRVFDLIQAEMR
ncbi:MAG: hypothetical protein PHR35_10405 [Kiritimatiellae bacterium]|nr:hypothetical protein [Kiritimatiellia bacterium]